VANARLRRLRRSPVTVDGPWLPVPIDFLRSRVCAELSPSALKLLADLCSQLGPNARGNGDLSAAPAVMKPRGWTSNATFDAAMHELKAVGLVVCTRQGGRNMCSLFAVTLWPMDCDFAKLDYGPGCYSTSDWRRKDESRVAPPNIQTPASWKRARKVGALASPATGEEETALPPPGGKERQAA
jgi:hypothetical protein